MQPESDPDLGKRRLDPDTQRTAGLRSDQVGASAGEQTQAFRSDRPKGGQPSENGGAYSFLAPAVQKDEIGRLGIYRVLHLLGKGGMAYVFLAEDMTLGRRVALKVMRQDLDNDPNASERFLREARLMASIRHEHLITVYQVGQEGRVAYLAMEWLQGETVEDRSERLGALPLPDILRIGRQVASGLAAIHQKGLIHRDLKPSNIWLEENGSVKILDFGLARFIQDDSRLTQTGVIVGTPAFMSPEQARGGKMDARSDLFSLGGGLYSLCTGKPPFEADSAIAVLSALALTVPRPANQLNPCVPAPLSKLVMRLLEKVPDKRPQSATEVEETLRRLEGIASGTGIVAGSPPRIGPTTFIREWQWLAAAVVLLCVIAFVAGKLWLVPPERPSGKAPLSLAQGLTKVYLSDLQPLEPLPKGMDKPPPKKRSQGQKRPAGW